jgi:DNA-directed RNA polymerase subunit RPC12/RpoP
MPGDPETQMIYRCPVCFGRENDVYMLRDGDLLYCPRCSYTGTEEQTREQYADLRKKYRWILKRVTLEEQKAL